MRSLPPLLLVVFLLVWGASCISPPYPKYFYLHHVPTVPALLVLIWAWRKWNVSAVSMACILGFLTLHVLGARYLYSYVPYDRWAETLIGVNLSRVFGFERNHFDRLVHLAFGVLLALPAARFASRVLCLSDGWSALFAWQLVLSWSAVYEVLEALIALVMAPDWAESYNGQQGDLWDAQKDMLLAAAGATLTSSAFWLCRTGTHEKMSHGQNS